MAELLSAWLEEQRGIPFSYDGADCGAFAASWVAAATGAPARRFGHYDSEVGCSRYVVAAGGMILLAHRAFRELGVAMLSPLAEPRAGDLGLISVEGKSVFGVFLGDFWSFKALTGIALERDVKILALGRLECLR